MPRILSRFTGISLACVLIGCLVSFFTGEQTGFDRAADRRRPLPNGSIPCKPGPWGELSYTPFTIAVPENLILVRSMKADGTHWFLKGFTEDSLITLLQSTSLSPEQQRAFLDDSVLHVRQEGIDLTPSPDLVSSLPEDARAKIYQIVAQSIFEGAQINTIPKEGLDERFSSIGVSPETVTLFKQLCSQRGNYVLFCGQAALFSRIPSYEEKVRLVKALTRQRTMLLRLHITPRTDVAALTQYWGKGCRGTDIRTIFQSFTTIPTGTWISALMVLPPLPTAEIYDFPNVDNPLNGSPVNRDCHWTSLNFFRDVPDPNFGKTEFVFRELKENYHPAPGAPRYGDVVLFTKPDGTIIHSAVYIADDICFTKNGHGLTQPWLLSTISDIIEQYSIVLDPDQKLTVSYYRNKRL